MTLVLVTESFLRRHFAMRLLKRIPLAAGVQYAIARIGGYLFIVLGFYVALTAAGISSPHVMAPASEPSR